MHYLGGKSRHAKQIAALLKGYRKQGQAYIEPFCGGLNVIALMDGVRIAADMHPYLIALYKGLQDGTFVPPTSITEQEYYEIKADKNKDPALSGFVGFACSFSGKWFGSYARNVRGKTDPTYFPGTASRSLARKFKHLDGVSFLCQPYDALESVDSLIYCDPPYEGTTGYAGLPKFDHAKFWDTVRKWSQQGNTVLVSEYQAPPDFEVVWEAPSPVQWHGDNKVDLKRIERIFKFKD